MTDSDDAPEWSADVFERAEIKRGGEVVRPASGTLTTPSQSMLDRAARALQERAGYTEYGPVVPESLTNDLVRAVLMAVREPDRDVRVAGRDRVLNNNLSPYADYSVAIGMGFTAMIDHILSEAQ